MSDYSFMKSGFDNVQQNDDTNENIIALISLFLENAIKTSATYTQHSKRNGITKEDIKRCMMLEIFLFTKRDDTLSQLENIKNEIKNETFESDDDFDIDDITIPEEELIPFHLSSCHCGLCKCLNNIYERWEKWTPSSPMEQIFKKHIDTM